MAKETKRGSTGPRRQESGGAVKSSQGALTLNLGLIILVERKTNFKENPDIHSLQGFRIHSWQPSRK
jgi:hypothetical protein